jgi:hypothetical protein
MALARGAHAPEAVGLRALVPKFHRPAALAAVMRQESSSPSAKIKLSSHPGEFRLHLPAGTALLGLHRGEA